MQQQYWDLVRDKVNIRIKPPRATAVEEIVRRLYKEAPKKCSRTVQKKPLIHSTKGSK